MTLLGDPLDGPTAMRVCCKGIKRIKMSARARAHKYLRARLYARAHKHLCVGAHKHLRAYAR